MYGGMFFVFSMGLFCFGIFGTLFFYSCPLLHIFFCFISVCLYGAYLIYDVQLLVGGKQHELSIDDYVFASIAIYLDIIIIFMRILELLNLLKNWC